MRFKECLTYDLRGNNKFRWKLLKRIILDSNYRVVVFYRFAISIKRFKLFRIIGKMLLVRLTRVPGVEFNSINPIGKGLSIQHAHDIVFGHGAIIKDNVTIYNGVTLGAKYFIHQKKDENSTLEKYPTICNNVIIFPGAKVIGNITIGTNSIIGANAVVLNSFKANSIIAGNPAKCIGNIPENENKETN